MRADRMWRLRGCAGFTLLEALIGLLIFSIGILTIIALQAIAIGHAGEARYRAEAAALATEIISQMWANADRSSDVATVRTTCSFAMNGTPCPTGYQMKPTPAVDKILTNWSEKVAAIPGGAATIEVAPTGPGGEPNFNQALVTIQWTSPNGTRHNFVTTANVH